MPRHLRSQASVRSTTQRRGLRRPGGRLRVSTRIGRMCDVYSNSSTTARAVGLSYPLSSSRCCSSSGRSTTIECRTSSRHLASCQLAGARQTASGPPWPSTSKFILVPFFARSVGLGPISAPQTAPCQASHRPLATSTRHRRVRRNAR